MALTKCSELRKGGVGQDGRVSLLRCSDRDGRCRAGPQPEKKKRKTSAVAWAALIALVVGAVYLQLRDSREQSLPALPIEVKYRGALLRPGMVLTVKNTSDRPLVAVVKLTNPTTRAEKSFAWI